MPELDRLDDPRLQASDAVVADLQLLLRGVLLPWNELGGALGSRQLPSSSHAFPKTVRLRVPPDLAPRIRACGRLVITDRESSPVGRISNAKVQRDKGDKHSELGAWVQGRPEPCGAAAPLLGPPGAPASTNGSDRGMTVLVCQRPLLRAEVRALRSAGGRTLLVVPEHGATPDNLPPEVLQRCLRTDAPDLQCVLLPIVWREPDSDDALARAIGSGIGGSRVQVLSSHEPHWQEMISDLNHLGDSPARNLVSTETWGALRRWRPPRTRRGLVVFFTGLSGSGKSTLARALVDSLGAISDRNVSLLDGDEVRRLLSSGLGFDRASRDLNVQRIGFVASEIARSGGIAVCAPIAPYATGRAAVRMRVGAVGDFVLVHVATPLEECERRDVKGLYAQARAGVIAEFTGVSDPYEEPADADLTIDTSENTPEEAVTVILDYLRTGGWLGALAVEEQSWTG